MKVYVDELPKSCLNCVCFNKVNGRCQLDNLYMDTDLEPIECPLHFLADYTKQVRKEVCEEIRKWCDKNFNWVGDGTGYDGQDYNEMIGSNNTINKLRKFLDQIQGVEDGRLD